MFKKALWMLAAVALVAAAACLLDSPEAPELMGPSELGRAVELRAVPDQLVADGWSSSVIEAVLRGPNSERIPGATIHFDIQGFVDLGNLAPLNGPRPTFGGVEGGPVEATTDGNGVARARYWAPFRTDQPSDTIVTILAREAGTNFRQVLNRAARADIFLRAADRPIPGPIPIPDPGCEAPSADLQLSGLCPSGEIKSGQLIRASGAGSEPGEGEVITTYIWNWGDGTQEVTGSSSASNSYGSELEGLSVTISLTVVNSCGGSASASASGIAVVAACP